MAEPFSLPNPFAGPLLRGLMDLARPALERALALTSLNRLYLKLPGSADSRHFSEKALEALGVTLDVRPGDLEGLPASGPLVLVANHPFGGLDGLAIAALVRRVRPDLKLLGNHFLRAIPDLDDSIIHVDPYGVNEAAARNAAGLRKALRWVRGGGALALFPAGDVSHVDLRHMRVSDPAWSEAAVRLVLATEAPVATIYFDGRNSLLFQTMGLLHPRLRTVMLPRELLAHRGRRLRVRVGRPIAASRLKGLGGSREATDYLRARTYILRGGAPAGRRAGLNLARLTASGATPARLDEPIAPAIALSLLREEVSALPASQMLLASGPFDVFHARAAQIPHALHEIGRLREIAFRRVGEGTGRRLDLDRFDTDYLHLFVWNRQTSEIVGAYRMGPTDEILPKRGLDGLYTSTLFRYRPGLLERLGPALEMGRSFIRPEYQKSHSPLTLLWKGIGRFVVANPRYRRLFGPVSISNEYQSMSRQLLQSFLQVNRYVSELGRLIRPRNRARFTHDPELQAMLSGTVVKNLDEVDTLIQEIETDRKSMPILLRQYLRLNGVLLGFNVDPEFGDVLDGLILVDLASVDRVLLNRYMGRDGLESFLARAA